MRRRIAPKRIWHRGRGHGRRSWYDWIRLIGMGGALLAVVAYLLWLFVFQPAQAAPTAFTVWLPLVGR
jgi:hypothetical protein